MGVNKFVYGNITKFDLTGDTVTAATLQQGYTAHGADGEAITGTLETGVTIKVWTSADVEEE